MSNHEILPADSSVPSFRLPASSGGKLGLWDFKVKRNLALYFLARQLSEPAHRLLADASRNYKGYRDEETEILVLVQAGIDEATRLQQELALPFPILADHDGSIHVKYLPAGYTGIFLLDRYGGLYHQFIAAEVSQLPAQSEILEYLVYLEAQCSY